MIRRRGMKYYFLNSEDSKNIHPLNRNTDFIVELPDKLEGAKSCALSEIKFQNSTNEDLYVFCDIIEYNYIKNNFLPILRTVTESTAFNNQYFIKIKQQSISRIRVYIRNADGEEPTLTGPTTCTLIFKHVG